MTAPTPTPEKMSLVERPEADEPKLKKPSLASEYSLGEAEMAQARRLHSQIVISKAGYAESISRVEQLEKDLETAKAQRDAQRTTVDCMITRSAGWADAMALARGDDNPVGFQVDFQNGMSRIVRVENANMG